MKANTLPSSIALLSIASVALIFSVGLVLWHRFGPTNRTLHNLLSGLSPQFARLITADYAEQVLGAETDGALAQLAYLGLATSRAYALGRATSAELHAVTRALSVAYGADFAKIAGKRGTERTEGTEGTEGAAPAREPDLVDLARRLGILGFPAELGSGLAPNDADEKLHLSASAGAAGAFVGKAVACACADDPKPFLAAQYARGAWKNKQAVDAVRRAPLDLGLPGAGGLWSVRSGHSTIAGARSAAELVDSQIELAGHYAYSGPAALASLTRANGQFGQAEQSQVGGSN
ncbi:MAG: hypothetical protein ABSA91_10475 [Acidimicrobiales bacterium]